MLRAYLLGGLALSWNDDSLPTIPGAAARSLLAYLITRNDRAHTRDLLAGTFWPDLPDATARRRLSQALWQIRSALQPHPLLLTEGNTVQFNPDLNLWLDITEFERQASRNEIQAVVQAVDLYRGEFLAGYYDDWAVVERERLQQILLQILEWLLEAYKARAEYERGLVAARRLAAEDPWREAAHREIMRLCHLLDRDAEALKQFEACRQILARELGVEPSPETIALAIEIATRAGLPEPPVLPSPARPVTTPSLERPDRLQLVGRQKELAELLRQLEAAIEGNGGLTVVYGEAGVGKSRLLRELADNAQWRGIRTTWGRCYELSAPPPYQPLVEALRAGLPGLRESTLQPLWLADLSRLLPELATGETPPPSLSPEDEQRRLLEAIARAFLTLAEVEPHLVLLEDAQWMDPASLEALSYLLPRLGQSRLLVVLTIRTEELADQAAERMLAMESTRLTRRLELGRLNQEETEQLVQRALDLHAPSVAFITRLYTETEGNPFFLLEVLRTLVEEGLLNRDEAGEWSTPWDESTQDYAEPPLPDGIAQSIQRRLDRLPDGLGELLGLAAVIGRSVDFQLWRQASGRDEEATMVAAEELVRRGLLIEIDEAPGYRFVHDMVRKVIYSGLSHMRRRQWHRRVGMALEAHHPGELESLAHHFCRGEDWPRSVRYALQAGERAQAVYANQQALAYYQQAEGWLVAGRVEWPDDEVNRWQAELAEQQGRVYSLLGEYAAAEAAFGRAREMWAALDDWRSSIRILNRLSFLHFVQDDHKLARRYAELALSVLPETGPPADLWATSLTHLGLSAWAQGRYDDAQAALEQALALFEEIGTDIWGLARCLNSLGLVHLDQGELKRAESCFARSLELRQQIGDRRGEAFCWHNQARAALARGALDTARQRLVTAQEIFAEIQHPYGLDNCARVLADIERAEATAGQTHEAHSERASSKEQGFEDKVHRGRVTARLPSANAPLGRTLHEEEFVTVAWTLDAPEDAWEHGKVARRRQRILRLLSEAQAQGAAPRDEDLAKALNVSLSTLRRDMAALRAEGHHLPTRWRKMST